MNLPVVIITLTLTLFFVPASRAVEATPGPLATKISPSCDFYLQKSARLHCLANEYLQRFGYHYCLAFLNFQSQFSPEGQVFVQGVRHCLIAQLARRPGLTCAQVKPVALQSHVECYRQNRFCSLRNADKLRIFLTVLPEIFDQDFVDVLNQINGDCSRNMSRPVAI